LIRVGGSGERECGGNLRPALVRPAAGVCVALRTRRDAARLVQAGGGFAD